MYPQIGYSDWQKERKAKMVDMGEILTGLWSAFAPFVGKAIIAIIVVGVLGFGIDLIAHKIKNRKRDE